MTNSNRRTLFFAAIAVAVLAVLVCIYYVIPGFSHVLVSGDPKAVHLKHVLAFAALAVVAIIGALVTRPKAAIS